MIKRFLMIHFVVMGFLWVSSLPAHAERNFKMGEKALSFSVADEDFVIGGRYFIEPHLAVLAKIGFQALSNDNSGTNFTIGGGLRMYLSKKSELLTYVDGTLAFVSEFTESADNTENGVELDGRVGVEYFLAKQVSAEAAVGVTLKTITGGKDVTTFGTTRTAITINFYLD